MAKHRLSDIVGCTCDAIRRYMEDNDEKCQDMLCPVCEERLARSRTKMVSTVVVEKIRLPGPRDYESGDREERIIALVADACDVVDRAEMVGHLFTKDEIREINLIARRLLRETMRL